ncbi:ribokinase [Alkalispirochaeta alkalica]|uniref:ribokinase n=1 Tax=Alkalispirochaeta alkalica TaxID=46356 RepID=UPI000361DFBB|nr:ribokinase [Alkalispirochaeta alkalica]
MTETHRPARIFVLGSLNVDLVVQVDRFPQPGETLPGRTFHTFPGGKGGNQAVAVARLGGSPSMAARLGDDSFGEEYLATLIREGVQVNQVERIPGKTTGTALIEVDQRGQNRIVVVAGANECWDDRAVSIALAGIAEGDILLLQLEIPLPAVIEAALIASRRGAQVILDPAPAPEAPLPRELLGALSWCTPNEHEAALITGIATSSAGGQREAALALVRHGVSRAVVKAGARGAWLALEDRAELLPGFPVEARDTTAAGDSFNGGLAWALSHHFSPREAVIRANSVAALSTTGLGAQTAMPTAAQLSSFLEKAGITPGEQKNRDTPASDP